MNYTYPQTKPLGIKILTFLFLSGSPLLLLILFIFPSNFDYSLLIISLGLTGFFAGLGMFKGKYWGWWLAASYMIFSIFRYSQFIYIVNTLPIDTEIDIQKDTLKYSFKIITHSLVCFYLFRNHVLEYFNLSHLNKTKTLLHISFFSIAPTLSFLLTDLLFK